MQIQIRTTGKAEKRWKTKFQNNQTGNEGNETREDDEITA